MLTKATQSLRFRRSSWRGDRSYHKQNCYPKLRDMVRAEDQTNDRFKTALVHRKYIVGDQSVIEAFILKQMNTKVINSHYQKLVNNYDTTGNQRNFILVYAKSKNFAGLWKKYQKHFSDFEDTSDTDSPKDNVKTGKTTNANRDVWHIFVNFGV
jgi:hypothetical protein